MWGPILRSSCLPPLTHNERRQAVQARYLLFPEWPSLGQSEVLVGKSCFWSGPVLSSRGQEGPQELCLPHRSLNGDLPPCRVPAVAAGSLFPTRVQGPCRCRAQLGEINQFTLKSSLFYRFSERLRRSQVPQLEPELLEPLAMEACKSAMCLYVRDSFVKFS